MPHAWQTPGLSQPLERREMAPLEPGRDELVLEVPHRGLCRSDMSMIDNAWGMSSYPLVGGHEAVGRATGRSGRSVRPDDQHQQSAPRLGGGDRLPGPPCRLRLLGGCWTLAVNALDLIVTRRLITGSPTSSPASLRKMAERLPMAEINTAIERLLKGDVR